MAASARREGVRRRPRPRAPLHAWGGPPVEARGMAANRLVWPKMAKPKVVWACVYRVRGVPGRGSHVRRASAPSIFLSEVCTTWGQKAGVRGRIGAPRYPSQRDGGRSGGARGKSAEARPVVHRVRCEGKHEENARSWLGDVPPGAGSRRAEQRRVCAAGPRCRCRPARTR